MLNVMLLSLICVCVNATPVSESPENPESPEFAAAQRRAKEGDFNAMCDLAMMYRKGVGTAEDAEQAIYWYKKAYKKGGNGVAEVADDLCQLYLDKKGVAQTDYFIQDFFASDKAEMYYRLADLYRNSCEENFLFTSDNQEKLAKAISYYELSYGRGNNKALKYLPALCLKLKAKDLVKAKKYYDLGIVGWCPSGNDFKDVASCPIAEYWFVEEQLKPIEEQASNVRSSRGDYGARSGYYAAPTTTNSSSQRATGYNPTYRLYITHNMIGNNAEEELIKLPWNSPKQRYTLGVSLGYVQKNYVRTGGADTHKGWRKSYGMAGVQAGVRVNPQFDKGWGFNTGLFYEFFYEPTQECIIPAHYGKGEGVKAKGTFQEHSLYVPAHFEYSAHLGKRFRLYAFGGLGFNLPIIASDKFAPIDSSVSSVSDSSPYGSNNLSSFATMLEYGGGLQIESLQVRFTFCKGLNNLSKISGEKVVVEQPSIVASFQF